MTDEAFTDRHESMEAEERKRFRNFITYPPVRRGRLSRESESNTLDTFSPDCSLNETSFQTDGASCLSYIHEERRRSGSTSRKSTTFDDYIKEYDYNDMEYMDPWPARQFPLPEDVYEEMKIEQNRASSTRNTYRRPRTVKVQDDPSMEFISPDFEQLDSVTFAASPAPSGTSTSTCDDDNDPEWNESRGDRRSSISMKHSKRWRTASWVLNKFDELIINSFVAKDLVITLEMGESTRWLVGVVTLIEENHFLNVIMIEWMLRTVNLKLSLERDKKENENLKQSLGRDKRKKKLKQKM